MIDNSSKTHVQQGEGRLFREGNRKCSQRGRGNVFKACEDYECLSFPGLEKKMAYSSVYWFYSA